MRHIFLLLLLTSGVFAEEFCSGKTIEFDVQVLDAKLRGIEGADVWIKYDPGTSFGDKYFTTTPKKTDSTGKVHYKIINQGTNTREIDCTMWIYAQLGNAKETVTVEATKHGSRIDINMGEVYKLDFYVRDQYKVGIPNASVTVGENFQKTDDIGFVRYYLPKGTYKYLTNFGEGKQSGEIKITDDNVFEVIFPYYDIVIEVKDDRGDPLPATLTIFGDSITLHDGRYESNRSYGEYVDYEVVYAGITEFGTIIPSEKPSAEIIYDVHAPTFGNIVAETVNKRTKLTFPLTDDGQFASGVDVTSVKVSYRLEPADATTPWAPATVFATGFNTFAAEFPQLPQNSIVQFRADAKDNAGNRAIVDGKFSTLAESEPVTENQSDTQKTEPEPQEIPLFYILLGVIIVIFTIYLVFRIKSKQ